ncbi:hypothetical protein [Pseudomonas sp. 2(2015)]|uniref:hypothetical protein n=1 Tax=Pseudomonas sp. 2(2015) TaxID=1619950 RepID=UPI0005EAF4FF|nr:hypothetical protein [Pseudomonas sp. 2(2015)]KJK17163.1 hypothetical protein UB48_15175 [Pseudomonas sp. 2(2015)]
MANPKKPPAAADGAASVTYRDTVYTSRVLILPGGRQLSVEKSQVGAPADDAEALAYLSGHSDLILQE